MAVADAMGEELAVAAGGDDGPGRGVDLLGRHARATAAVASPASRTSSKTRPNFGLGRVPASPPTQTVRVMSLQ